MDESKLLPSFFCIILILAVVHIIVDVYFMNCDIRKILFATIKVINHALNKRLSFGIWNEMFLTCDIYFIVHNFNFSKYPEWYFLWSHFKYIWKNRKINKIIWFVHNFFVLLLWIYISSDWVRCAMMKIAGRTFFFPFLFFSTTYWCKQVSKNKIKKKKIL